MLSHDGSLDEAEYPAGLCAPPSAASTAQAVGEERTSEVVWSQRPTGSRKVRPQHPGEQSPLCSVSRVLVRWLVPARDVHHWVFGFAS